MPQLGSKICSKVENFRQPRSTQKKFRKKPGYENQGTRRGPRRHLTSRYSFSSLLNGISCNRAPHKICASWPEGAAAAAKLVAKAQIRRGWPSQQASPPRPFVLLVFVGFSGWGGSYPCPRALYPGFGTLVFFCNRSHANIWPKSAKKVFRKFQKSDPDGTKILLKSHQNFEKMVTTF